FAERRSLSARAGPGVAGSSTTSSTKPSARHLATRVRMLGPATLVLPRAVVAGDLRESVECCPLVRRARSAARRRESGGGTSELHGAQTRDSLLRCRVGREVVLHLPLSRAAATARSGLELRLRLRLERVDDVRTLLRRVDLLHRDALRVDVDLLERARERFTGAEELGATGVGVELTRT